MAQAKNDDIQVEYLRQVFPLLRPPAARPP
jgi:hypothetical protein